MAEAEVSLCFNSATAQLRRIVQLDKCGQEGRTAMQLSRLADL
jgi:hypothetical protein